MVWAANHAVGLVHALHAGDEFSWRIAGFQYGTVRNIEVEIRGAKRADEIVIVGAHYDSARGTPGANDNGSGTAMTLELARRFHGRTPARTLRFVFFVNEEPPYFGRSDMGSRVYADRSAQRNETIVAMLSLETLGYYDQRLGRPPTFPFRERDFLWIT